METAQPNKEALLNRLKRIEGQVRGVQKMVDNDKYCVDIFHQISAIQSAKQVSVSLSANAKIINPSRDSLKPNDIYRP
ncbi:metal-sensitive transcriptional regulator [Salicibibacter cibi]|uniref:Metal-sensitive transcriptional regulator n=1 Tax=Salicibibacter cibi TaxID=2743001 RepID=A0A7T6ZAR6_9BACI|nr:metal-sensitive transcriptional regulator [Salicibibacter cibi]QQK80063.1 metal-sensitive transcriptional regulator [Salicibibacter cibi]